MRYQFIPSALPLSNNCFLIEALYWIAFERYPNQTLDITSDKIEPNIVNVDDTGHIEYDLYPKRLSPITGVSITSYISPKISKKYGLPENPDFENYGSMTDVATKILDTGLIEDWREREDFGHEYYERQATEDEIDEARKYLKDVENFKEALDDYLSIFKSKLIIALNNGKIKAYGISANKEYVYNSKSKTQFEKIKEYDTSTYNKLAYEIKEGDTFHAVSPDWMNNKAVEIPKEYWATNKIDWDMCHLCHKSERYVYIQVNVDDLFKEFPSNNTVKKDIVRIGDTYIFDSNEKIEVTETRGRKPKMDYEELTMWLFENIERVKEYKKDAIVEELQKKFPQIKTTTIKNKTYRYIDAYRQKNNQK